MKAYITRYALTQGILEVEADELPPYRRRAAEIMFQLPGYYLQYCRVPDWHRTKEEAVAHAEKMRIKTIASLKTKLAKLEQLSFP